MEQWYCRHDDDEKDWTGGHVRSLSKACGPIKASNNLHPQISLILVLLGLYKKKKKKLYYNCILELQRQKRIII